MSAVVAEKDKAGGGGGEAKQSFARRDHLLTLEAAAQKRWREEKLFEVCQYATRRPAVCINEY